MVVKSTFLLLNIMKYILKKEYPGSPKLNAVINDEITTFGVSFAKNNLNSIENYPEFWQPVVEKDYEILSLIEDKFIYPCDKYSEDFINQLFNTLGVSIYSVKRLSDSEIFTIGDIVDNGCNFNCEIKKLYINDNKLIVDMNLGGWQYINYIQKVKQKLFTTEDGVDIFEGDDIYSICNMLNIKKHRLFNARYDDNTLLNNRIFFNSDYKHFSTKEKAEEYILYNKPLLTLKDIDELLCKNTSSYFLEKFKKRAQKLNNNN